MGLPAWTINGIGWLILVVALAFWVRIGSTNRLLDSLRMDLGDIDRLLRLRMKPHPLEDVDDPDAKKALRELTHR